MAVHSFENLVISGDIVSPINLINAIIINYLLSIERSALEFTAIIFFPLGAYVVPGDIKKVLLLYLSPLSQVVDCEAARAVCRRTLKRYVRACKK